MALEHTYYRFVDRSNPKNKTTFPFSLTLTPDELKIEVSKKAEELALKWKTKSDNIHSGKKI